MYTHLLLFINPPPAGPSDRPPPPPPPSRAGYTHLRAARPARSLPRRCPPPVRLGQPSSSLSLGRGLSASSRTLRLLARANTRAPALVPASRDPPRSVFLVPLTSPFGPRPPPGSPLVSPSPLPPRTPQDRPASAVATGAPDPRPPSARVAAPIAHPPGPSIMLQQAGTPRGHDTPGPGRPS